MTTIERMAEAIRENDRSDATLIVPWDSTDKRIREHYRGLARAALSVLGDGMEEAVDAVVTAWLAKYPHVPPTTLYDMANAAAPLIRAPLVAEVETLKAALESVGIGFIEGEGWYYTTVDGEEPSEDGSLLAALQATMALTPEVVAPQPPDKYEGTLAAYRKVNSKLTEEKATAEARVQRLEELVRWVVPLLRDAVQPINAEFLGRIWSDAARKRLAEARALLPEETTK